MFRCTYRPSMAVGVVLLWSAVSAHADEFEMVLTLDSVTNLHGGIDEGSDVLANLDVSYSITTQECSLWGNGEFFVYVLGTDGDNPSERIGDVQVTSNIEADDGIKVYELWYQHHFFDNSFHALTGLHDFNSAFSTLNNTDIFLNSSFGIGPDISQTGPSIFPTTALGVHLLFERGRHYFQFASYDGVPGDPENPRGTHVNFDDGDGLFNAMEWGMVGPVNAYYKLALGVWQHTTDAPNDVRGGMSSENSGAYFLAEKNISERTGLFLQLGKADNERNFATDYIGAGIKFAEFASFPGSAGIGVAHVLLNEDYRQTVSQTTAHETAVEFTYRVELGEHFALQPDLQYIVNPGFDATLDNAVVFSLRFEASL